MQLPYLDITSRQAQIGIQTNRANIQIDQTQPRIQLDTRPAKVTYQKSEAKLEIDQSQAFKEANLMNILERNKQWVQKAKQKAMQGTAKNAQQGDQLMKIESGFGAIPRIAKANSEPKYHEFNIGFMPSSAFSIKFRYTPGSLKISTSQNNLTIDAKLNPPVIKYNKWDTNIYMKQKNSIDIQAVGLHTNRLL